MLHESAEDLASYGDTDIRTHEGLKNLLVDYHPRSTIWNAALANRRHTAIAEADAFGLEHIECAGQMIDHRAGHRIAGALSLADGVPAKPSTGGEVFDREAR